jgi:hypothetical protein
MAFNVQEFFMDVAQNQNGLAGTLPPAIIGKLRASAVYKVLSAKWKVQEAPTEVDTEATEAANETNGRGERT